MWIAWAENSYTVPTWRDHGRQKEKGLQAIACNPLFLLPNSGGPPVSRTRHQRIMSLRVHNIPTYFVIFYSMQNNDLGILSIADAIQIYAEIHPKCNPGVTPAKSAYGMSYGQIKK